MQYYTKQQLQGGLSYKTPCRLGNWTEDNNQDEAKLKDFLKSKAEGGLKLDVLRMRMERAMMPVRGNSLAGDSCVRFSGTGDGVCVVLADLQHTTARSFLDCDEAGVVDARAQPSAASQQPSSPQDGPNPDLK